MTTPKTPHTPQIVFTGEDGNVFAWAPSHKRQQQLTWSWEEYQGKKETENAPLRLTHMWPAWAPDGKQIACFGMRGAAESQVETSLYAVAADGIESWELSGLSGGMPIYGNWSPNGDAFAALVQRNKQLSLEIIKLDQLGITQPVISGAPLFWSWAPQGNQLVAHVGGSSASTPQARVVVVDTESGQIQQQVTDRPGEFRVPVWSPQENLITYVERDEHENDILFLYDVDTGEKGPVTTVGSGTVALWSADGTALAFSSMSRAGSSIFPEVKVLDLETGRTSTVLDEPVLGFFWSPQSDFLLYLTIDQQQNFICWNRLMRISGEKTELARFLPSREQMFILSFFDQYALSHPPLAPDGSALAFAGYLVTPVSTTSTSHVYCLSLTDATSPPKKIAPGQFVSWNI
jgi:dipeptidyl aminopeptidase/acylaminoacyl peptidase